MRRLFVKILQQAEATMSTPICRSERAQSDEGSSSLWKIQEITKRDWFRSQQLRDAVFFAYPLLTIGLS